MNNRFITLVLQAALAALMHLITLDASAQPTRLESTAQLKKVVYVFDPSQSPQMVTRQPSILRECTSLDGQNQTNGHVAYYWYLH